MTMRFKNEVSFARDEYFSTKIQAERKTILLVDDNATSLAAGKQILKERYKVYPTPSAEIMFDLLENLRPDLILLDIEMPGMDGYEALAKLKSTPELASIPVIFLTSLCDGDSEFKGLGLGAIDYVGKPFSGSLLMRRIDIHLRMEAQRQELKTFNNNLQELVSVRTEQMRKLQIALLDTIADLVEFRDSNTGGHVTRTQHYMQLLLNEAWCRGIYRDQMASWNLDIVMLSSQLHDVGKITVSDAILNKPGKLNEEELVIMRTHVSEGVKIIRRIAKNVGDNAFLSHALLVASAHHERWDGGGYPLGLSGQDIPLEGRLMAIADVYDALVSSRPYKSAYTTDAAYEVIINGSGSQFDPELVKVFKGIAAEFARVAKESC
ncbi:MAG: response regulator [Coriobacteriales bacterium]|jgi:putative two-component system response regulator|nr:response regulator [Coriobacteriales bacterium]